MRFCCEMSCARGFNVGCAELRGGHRKGARVVPPDKRGNLFLFKFSVILRAGNQ